MLDVFKRAIFASVGAVMMTEEKVREIIDELVHKGEVSEKEGEGLFKDLINSVENTRDAFEEKFHAQLEKALDSFNVAHKKDVQALKRKIKKLDDKIESLSDEIKKLQS